jgi:predicted house-cleaning noncanonical NTP pyrophosphatase (MazG superfamily)
MEKLIRHKLPTIRHPSYPDMKTRNVQSLEEHVHFLIHKIYEELSEVRDADDEDAQVDEYADLLEVADTILCLSMDPE